MQTNNSRHDYFDMARLLVLGIFAGHVIASCVAHFNGGQMLSILYYGFLAIGFGLAVYALMPKARASGLPKYNADAPADLGPTP